MVKIIIDWDKVQKMKEKIITFVIIKRAYRGYLAFSEIEKVEPLHYSEFSKLEFYKIVITFRQYMYLLRGQKYRKAKVCFKSVVFDSF